MGLLLCVIITGAGVQDRDGARPLLEALARSLEALYADFIERYQPVRERWLVDEPAGAKVSGMKRQSVTNRRSPTTSR
jgi:hypothetical protein